MSNYFIYAKQNFNTKAAVEPLSASSLFLFAIKLLLNLLQSCLRLNPAGKIIRH
jgi:hypothetical protein